MREMTKVRDLTVWKWTEKEWLVFATDGLAGIGQLPHDEVPAPPEVVGYFTARVGLFELLAANVTPELLIDTQSTGGEYATCVLAGIRSALLEAGLLEDFPITGSTEDNVTANVTALGITVIGSVAKTSFRPGTARAGDEVWLIGTPKSAPQDEVLRGDPSSVSFSQLRRLQSMPCVHEILPVGSKGAADEAEQLAATAGLYLSPLPAASSPVCLKSGGPATSVIVAGTMGNHEDWLQICSELPCLQIGWLSESLEGSAAAHD